MDLLLGLFSAFGLSASAGLNAYIPLFTIAVIAHFTDWFKLNSPYDALGSPWTIGILAVLITIEFLADKIPAVNHINDGIQTFVRPVAGAILFAASASVITDVSPILSIAAGVLVSGGVHAAKSLGVRPLVTATTGGAANVPVSMAEDLISTLLSFIAVVLPVIIACFLVMMTAWILWRAYRRSRAIPAR